MCGSETFVWTTHQIWRRYGNVALAGRSLVIDFAYLYLVRLYTIEISILCGEQGMSFDRLEKFGEDSIWGFLTLCAIADEAPLASLVVKSDAPCVRNQMLVVKVLRRVRNQMNLSACCEAFRAGKATTTLHHCMQISIRPEREECRCSTVWFVNEHLPHPFFDE